GDENVVVVIDSPYANEIYEAHTTITGEDVEGATVIAYVDGEEVGRTIASSEAFTLFSTLEIIENNGVFTNELAETLPVGTEITLVQIVDEQVSERTTIEDRKSTRL